MTALESDYYLIVRPPDALADAAGVSSGFLLLAVRPARGMFESPFGEVGAAEDQRFMYAGDVARAVRRGSATAKEPGVVVGQRIAALAAYPHLRPRHVLGSSPSVERTAVSSSVPAQWDGPAPGPSHPRSQSEAAEVAEVAEPAEAAADGNAETDEEAAPAVNNAETLEPRAVKSPPSKTSSDVGRARGKGQRKADAAPPSARRAKGKTQTRTSAASLVTPDEEFASIIGQLERGELPDAGELAELPRVSGSWAAVVEATTVLKLADQVSMARELVLQMLGEDSTRQTGDRWLVELGDRVRNRSDLLLRLIEEVWQYADPQGALNELRSGIKRGTLRLSQRNPVPLAPLMRELARMVDDADSLAEAYLAMADSPERRFRADALMDLLAEAEAEEAGANGERTALARELLLLAFRCAGSEDFARLVPHAERQMRAALRQEPPAIDVAESLRPVLEAGLEHVDDALEDAIQDCLRELASVTGSEARAEAVSMPDHIATLTDALDYVRSASANVEVLPTAYESARQWGKKPHKYIPQVMDAMKAIAEVAAVYAADEIGPEGFHGAFRHRGQDLVRRDSDQTRQRYAAEYLAKDEQGKSVRLEMHLRLGRDFRIYLTPDKATRRLLVGRVGAHLKVGRR